LADLHILRKHALGLPKARKIAFQWAERAEKDFSMDCTYQEGGAQDEVAFSRSGVKGTLMVTADKFELNAALGFLLGAFKGKIEGEIVKNLDALLATESAKPAAAKKAATKK
jgi:putative polyhydroxyalkanoate system protein